MGASSRESTASSPRAHLQRKPRPSSYAHEPSSQEPKLGRNDRLAAPGRTPPRMVAWLPPPPRALLSSTQELHHGTAAGHGCSVRSCRVRAARAGWRRPWPHPGAPRGCPGGRRLRRQPMTSSPGRSGLGGSRGRSPVRLGKQLRVDGGGHHGLGADQASLDQQRELQVLEATTLTHPGALAVHGHTAADHQVHGLQLAQRQSAARRAPSRDRGGAPLGRRAAPGRGG